LAEPLKQKIQVQECPPTLWPLEPILEWLFHDGRMIKDQTDFVHQLSHKIVQAGAPVDRLTLNFPTLNPLVLAISATWTRKNDTTVPLQPRHDILLTDRYIGSPMQKVHETKRNVRQSLTDLPENSHLAYIELAEAGFIDYYAMPITFGIGRGSIFIVATKNPGGFSECDVKNLKRLRDYVAPILEVFSLRHLSASLMDTYVGKRTSQKVLSGMIKRGDADIINAALWFSDLREFTHLTETLSTDEVLLLLNEYFEFVAAAATARGGEILRFIGDAMLIVFPIDEKITKKAACIAALESARDAQQTLAALNHQRRRHLQPEIKFGVGLNVGEVIYGNVGAPDRLDFTVMGPAVNRTARLESLTKSIGESILISEDFAAQVDCPTKYYGEHNMTGISQPQKVFAPDESCG
jgi:adenylate cyclase